MNSGLTELKTLKEEYLIATRELSRVKPKAFRRELKEYVNDLKINLSWTLLDYGKYEEGLVLFESLSWRDYGETKYNGMARTLIEMKCMSSSRAQKDSIIRESS